MVDDDKIDEYDEKIRATEDRKLEVDMAFQRYTESIRISENPDI